MLMRTLNSLQYLAFVNVKKGNLNPEISNTQWFAWQKLSATSQNLFSLYFYLDTQQTMILTFTAVRCDCKTKS